MPGKEIIQSNNSALSYLINTKNRNAKFAIVASDGSGHYLTIKEAIDNNANFILIRNGTYEINEDITISYQNIIGESKNGVILNLNDSSINVETTTEVKQSTTEITLTQASQNITKVSTSPVFTDVSADGTTKMYLDSFFARVEEIIDDDNLNITIPFYGRVLNIDNWALFNTTTEAVKIENITINCIFTESKNAINIQGLNARLININFFSENIYSTFIYLGSNYPAISNIINKCSFQGGKDAIYLYKAYCSNISECDFQISQNWDIYSYDSSNKFNIINNNIFSGSLNSIRSIGKGNKIYNNKFEQIRYYCIYFGNTKDDIEWNCSNNNTFINCSDSSNAVIFSKTSNNRIYNNYFKACENCIVIDTSSFRTSNQIINNSFIECNNELNIDGKNNLIKENNFKDSVSGSVCITLNSEFNVIANNSFIDCNEPIPALSNDIFNNNYIEFSSYTVISLSCTNSSINNNTLLKTGLSFSGDKVGIRNNKFQSVTSGYSLTITGDKSLIVNNIFYSVLNGIDIQATADKTHVLENVFNTVTTTTIQDNGTNTVTANNIV